MPRAKSICSIATDTGRCLRTNPCPTHKRPAWAGSKRNLNRPADWRKRRSLVIRRDGFKCVRCGSSGPLEVDHILSIAKGGSWEPTNLQTLCSECHRVKTIGDSRRT